LVKGYVERIVLCHKETVVAEHVRSWGKKESSLTITNYLRLLERKPGSLDHARPLMDLSLPECLTRFAVVSKERREKKERDSGSLFGSCDSWRITPWISFERRSRRPL